VLGPALSIFLLSLVVSFVCLARSSPHREMDGDAPYYLSLAQSLASGEGYVNHHCFWPTAPNTERAPGWPAMASLGLRAAPHADPKLVVRVVATLLNAMAAPLVVVLCWLFAKRWGPAVLAGVFTALNPTGLAPALGAESEPAFVALALVGSAIALLGLTNPPARRLPWLASASLILGYCCLIRPNELLLPFCLGATWLMFGARRWRQSKPVGSRTQPYRLPLLCVAIFMLPAAIWVSRNYLVTGIFPVLASIRGETLYGANNAVVANDLRFWGHWVMPDEIPGQEHKRDLARRMANDAELDQYYYAKGLAYIRAHWFSMPRLLVGKLIRAFVPVPWVPRWESYIACLFRWVLYLSAALTIRFWRGRLPAAYKHYLLALLLVNLLTALVFYGNARFTYCFEVFLVPTAAVGLGEWLQGRSRGEGSGTGDAPGATVEAAG
jgi:hypothetical protein